MYPTPEQLRCHEAHARKMAGEYRDEGREAMAARREEDADFYAILATREELRIEHAAAEHHREAA